MQMMNEAAAKELFLKMVQDAIDETSIKMARELERRLCARPQSEYYFRTGELVSALMNPPKAYYSGNNIIFNLVDESKIHQAIVKASRRFNEHMSLGGQKSYDGMSIKYHSLINQNYGYTVPTGKKITGLHYIEGALGSDNIEAYLNDEVQNLLRKYLFNLMKGVK